MNDENDKRPPRIQTRIAAVLVDENGGELTVEVLDLSSGGFRLRAPSTLKDGAQVILKVRHNEFPAEIIWVEGQEAGGRFLEPAKI